MAYNRARGDDSTSGMFLAVLNDVAVDDFSRSRLRASVQALLEDEIEDVQQDDVLLSRFFGVLDGHRYAAVPSLDNSKAAETVKAHFMGLLIDIERRCRDEGDYVMGESPRPGCLSKPSLTCRSRGLR